MQYLWVCVGCAVAAGQAHAQHSLSAKWISFVGAENESDTVYAIATDSHTNAYFGGRLGTGELANTDGLEIMNVLSPWKGDGCDGDGFVAKVAADGTLQWSACLSYGNGSVIHGVAHADGATYAGGAFGNYVDCNFEGDTRTDAILTKLDAGTGALVWSSVLGGEVDRFCTLNGYTAVAADAAGYIYAAGYTTLADLQTLLPDSAHGGGTDAVVVKYAPGGSVEWVRYLGGAGEDKATAIAIGAGDAVFVVGQTCSPGWTTLGDNSMPSPASAYGFLAKLDTHGTVVYSTLLGGNGNDNISAILSDRPSGALIIAGQTSSGDFCAEISPNLMQGSAGGFVMGLTDLGASCETNWFRFVGGSGNKDAVNALAWMDNGHVIAGGVTGSGGWLAPQGEAAFGYNAMLDGFLLQLNKSTGAPLWSTYVGGTSNDAIHALAVAGEAVFSGGYTFSPEFADEYDGFWDKWEKEENFWGDDPYAYGFIGKWTQGAGLPPLIKEDLKDLVRHEGENAVFALLVEATPSPAYYWTTNGIPVPNAPNPYTIFATVPSDDNTMVCCVVSNIFGSATSHVARLTVIANGSLAVTLTPQEAVAQGANWSINGGATWNASGATLVLWPDSYTVVFANVPGWETPAPQNVNVSPGGTASCSAAYTPILATAARAIADTNVTLTVQMPSGATGWTLVETLPNNLTPTLYDASAVWDSTARTLTFTGTTSTALTYTVTASVSGIYAVSGQLTSSPSGISASVTGDTQIICANLLRVINGTQVTIHVKQPSDYFMIMETVPNGLTPSNITSGGLLMGNIMYWMAPNITATLSYDVTGAPDTYSVNGQGTLSSMATESIFGDSVIAIPDPNQPAVTPDILAFSIQGATGTLTFTSAVNQAYMVMTNATLTTPNGWHDCLPVTGTGPTTTTPVPATAPQLFYRIKVISAP